LKSGPRFLVVDDNPEGLKAAMRALKKLAL
jgi:hypothetical protein